MIEQPLTEEGRRDAAQDLNEFDFGGPVSD